MTNSSGIAVPTIEDPEAFGKFTTEVLTAYKTMPVATISALEVLEEAIANAKYLAHTAALRASIPKIHGGVIRIEFYIDNTVDYGGGFNVDTDKFLLGDNTIIPAHIKGEPNPVYEALDAEFKRHIYDIVKHDPDSYATGVIYWIDI